MGTYGMPGAGAIQAGAFQEEQPQGNPDFANFRMPEGTTYGMPGAGAIQAGAFQEEQPRGNPDFANFRMPEGTIQDNVAPDRRPAAPGPTIADSGKAPASAAQSPTIASPQPAKTEPAKTEPLMSGDDIKAGVGSALNQIGELSDAAANTAQTKYNQQIQEWKRNGQFWMDPNADVAPDLDNYIKAMPSSLDALVEGQFLNDIHGDNAWIGAFLDPTTAIVTAASGASGDEQNFASYVSAEGLEGAASGYASTGAWGGAVVGAVIGVVTGLVNWFGAADEDKANIAKARAEYERLMKAWQQRQYFRTQTAVRAGETSRAQREAALAEKKKAEKKEAGQEKRANATTRRQQFTGLMDYMQKYGTAYRNYRQQRWA